LERNFCDFLDMSKKTKIMRNFDIFGDDKKLDMTKNSIRNLDFFGHE